MRLWTPQVYVRDDKPDLTPEMYVNTLHAHWRGYHHVNQLHVDKSMAATVQPIIFTRISRIQAQPEMGPVTRERVL